MVTEMRIDTKNPSSEQGSDLQFDSLLSVSPQHPGRALRKALTENATENGLSYKSCKALQELIRRKFSLKGTRGVWDNRTTAKNFCYVALDSIPGFRGPRVAYVRLLQTATRRELTDQELKKLDGHRATLASLIYENILSNGKGAGTEFIKRNGLGTLVANPRSFLSRTESLGAVIRFALPGLIDEERQGCIRPHHIEHYHLNDPEYCKRLFIRTLRAEVGGPLDTYLACAPGDTASRKRARVELATAIRERIIKPNGGGEVWLAAQDINSLISREALQLPCESFGGLLRRFLPEVVDEQDPEAIQPHEVHHGEWQSPAYTRVQVLRALAQCDSAPAAARCAKSILAGEDPTAEDRQAGITAAADNLALNAFVGDFGLRSLHIRPPAFLSSRRVTSLRDFAEFCFLPES